jgi:hypothetical protein
MVIAEVCYMPRTIDSEPKWTAVSSPCRSDRRFWDAASRFRLARQKPLAGSPDSAGAPAGESQQGFLDAGSSERWFYFAIAVFFVAIIATFGMLIWQIARAFK